MTVPEVGALWESASMVWGERMGSGAVIAQESPFGFTVQKVPLLTRAELDRAFGESDHWSSQDVSKWAVALAEAMQVHRREFVESLRISTGFVPSDCEEIVDSCIDYSRNYIAPGIEPPISLRAGERVLKLEAVPWGTVAAVLPQNTFLSLAITVLLNALATGNRVVLRPPTGGLRLAAMLAEAVVSSGVPKGAFSIVASGASDFIEAWSAAHSPTLLHFMGDSERGSDLLDRSWNSGKPLLIDGTGNTWIFVDADQDPKSAAELLWMGATRYNGETCTSVNGVVAHPAINEALENELRRHVDVCVFGCDIHVEVGPLFSDRQAKAMRMVTERSEGVEHRAGNDGESVFAPTLVIEPSLDSDLVRKGVFAPALWMTPGTWEEFKELWLINQYPLCAGVLSSSAGILDEAKQLPNASRVVLNGDPSVEDPREPWGAYPRCGLNPVGEWWRKYLRTVQIDRPTSF